LIENADAGIQDLQREHAHAVKIKPGARSACESCSNSSDRIRSSDEFLKELFSFAASKNDDQVDALSQALAYARRPGPPPIITGTYRIGR
jgi:phage terminase large subunit-like protein